MIQLSELREAEEWAIRSAPECMREPINTDVCWEVEKWCRIYAKHEGQGPYVHFGIGVYQIYQAKKHYSSKGMLSEAYQACAACCLHIIAAASGVGCQIYCEEKFSEIPTITYDAQVLLDAITAAQTACLSIHSNSWLCTSKENRQDLVKRMYKTNRFTSPQSCSQKRKEGRISKRDSNTCQYRMEEIIKRN